MWKEPPVIKIYEALGAVADERIEVLGNAAKCYSSSGNKYYDVSYDPALNAIMANDNGSYWKGYLGYPSIAFLLAADILPYKENMGALLKGVKWKDINQQYKNDFDAALAHILSAIPEERRRELQTYVAELHTALDEMQLQKLGKRTTPPEGY